jgi:hypothetical protein
MVDIHIQAAGPEGRGCGQAGHRAAGNHRQGIDGVEHVYSQTIRRHAMVTARFLVGTRPTAILRVHEKMRANLDRIPVGIPEPLIVGRGIDDVAIVSLTLSPSSRNPGMRFRQRPDAGGARTAGRTRQDRQCRPDLPGRRGAGERSASRPIRSGSRSTASRCSSSPARCSGQPGLLRRAKCAISGEQPTSSPARR